VNEDPRVSATMPIDAVGVRLNELILVGVSEKGQRRLAGVVLNLEHRTSRVWALMTFEPATIQ
jgi:hypothetical protein